MKNCNHFLNIFCVLFLITCFNIQSRAGIEVKNLICEYKTNPIGIGVLNPRLSWQIASSEREFIQTGYEIRFATSIAGLRSNGLFRTTGKVSSSQSVNVVYNGPDVKSMERIYWQVRCQGNKKEWSPWSEPAFWEMGILVPSDWKGEWISVGDEKEIQGSRPAQYFRKEFTLTKKIKAARVYLTALGLYELHLNGAKVSADLFTPGWTSYKKRLQYQTYDITSLLKRDNAIGVVLGDGWYRGNLGFSKQNSYYGKQLALLLQLQVTYTDGTSEAFCSDRNWKVTQNGPIVESDIYNGEFYDARLELTGWDQPGYEMSKWHNVIPFSHSKEILISPQGVPVKAIQEIKPVKLLTTPMGETVFDLGQNMVGWARLKVSGTKGDRITLKFAEVLDKAGNFYTENLRAAKCTDVYMLKGGAAEIFEPHFTFHGFRYVKIEGLTSPPSMDQITGVVIHSDMKQTGNFSCSDTLINQLQHNIQWGQKGNFLDVPTDCPQRDERLGWTGDAQLFSMTAAFNFDVAPFYTKWLGDFTVDQLPDGKVPVVIPDALDGFGGSSVWSDACIIIPWTLWLTYGDRRILETQYPCMKKWVDFMAGRAGAKHLWLGDWHYGDWLAFEKGGVTENDLIASAYYFNSTRLLGKMAAIIGKKEDAEKYGKLAVDIKDAFNREFVTPNGKLTSQTQTAYALALAFDLLPESSRLKSAAYLTENIEKFGHLTTGLAGTPLLCKTLSATGHQDLAFRLLNNRNYPSWLYPVLHGATTIWERWDGLKPDGTFQDATMNSFNHYAYGAIGEWLYRYVAGIDTDPEIPGYKHIQLAPHPGGGLSFARGEINTLYGKVSASWRIENNEFLYDVSIPENTTALVTLPGAIAALVRQDGLPLKSEYLQINGDLRLSLGSGSYRFNYPLGTLKTALVD
jgi:alpha-L-rhamnosidase